jgi:cell division protein FtsL
MLKLRPDFNVRHVDHIKQAVRGSNFRDLAAESFLQRFSDALNTFPFKEVLLTLGLLFALMVSAIGVVYSSHISRQLFAEQALLLEKNDQLQLEWAQLLLEQSAFTSPGQIENVAAKDLNMVLPRVSEIELVH